MATKQEPIRVSRTGRAKGNGTLTGDDIKKILAPIRESLEKATMAATMQARAAMTAAEELDKLYDDMREVCLRIINDFVESKGMRELARIADKSHGTVQNVIHKPNDVPSDTLKDLATAIQRSRAA